jgi:alanyl-tRNA synthetase
MPPEKGDLMFARLLLATLFAAALAFAQGKKGGGSKGGMGDGMGDFRPQRQSKIEQFADRLKLSKEQKEEAQAALSAALEESAPVRNEIDKSRVAIAGAMIEGKSADEIKKLQDEYTAVAVKWTAIEVKAFTRVYASLKPNQQQKAGQAFELLAEALDSIGSGGGGRGGRGGQGRSR